MHGHHRVRPDVVSSSAGQIFLSKTAEVTQRGPDRLVWAPPVCTMFGPDSPGTEFRCLACAARTSLVVLCLALAAVLTTEHHPLIAMRPRVTVQQPAATGAAPEIPAVLKSAHEWAAAAAQHEMGSWDEHAARIAGWGANDVYEFITQLPEVLRFVTKQGGRGFYWRDEWVSREQVAATLGLTADELRAGDVTRIVRRGALLHADIARRGIDERPEWGAIAGDPRPSRQPGVAIVADGRLQHTTSAAAHWRFGRYLIDRVKPEPSRDPVAVAWYRGAAAWLQRVGRLADVETHLRDAQQLFHDDAVIVFYEGVLRESYSSPMVQAVLESSQPGRGQWFPLGSAGGELRRARGDLSRAIGLDPRFLEARLHLGRVLGRLGDHREAASELRIVADGARDPLVVYYARLFLGAEEEALGRHGAARESYEAAALLYPGAQSPRLALGQLSWRTGDRAAARTTILDALGKGRPGVDGDDPWWDYLVAPGRHADAFFDEARRACLEGERR